MQSDDLNVMRGPVLPTLAGHDPHHPSPEALHEVEREVGRLSQEWHRFAPLAQAAQHRGVSLLEALEYHFVGRLLEVVVAASFPAIIEARARRARSAQGVPATGPAPRLGTSRVTGPEGGLTTPPAVDTGQDRDRSEGGGGPP